MAEANIIGGLAGGAMIGFASVLLLLTIGRVAGVSGILGGAIDWKAGEGRPWRIAFLAGLIVGAVLYKLFWGPLSLQLQAQGVTLAFAGLLVGIGTRIGSGCTSGHGVCGVARGSKRSVTATLTFVGIAALTVYITRHAIA